MIFSMRPWKMESQSTRKSVKMVMISQSKLSWLKTITTNSDTMGQTPMQFLKKAIILYRRSAIKQMILLINKIMSSQM